MAPIPVLFRPLTQQKCELKERVYAIFSENNNNNISDSPRLLEIEELLLSLSTDTDDKSRRGRLSQIFEEKIQDQDGGESFMKFFDQAMIVVGDRVRMSVANEAAVATSDSLNMNDGDGNDVPLPSFPLPSQQQKSILAGQLWACVDMMVQSKKLMKSARIKSNN
jgi:hypothetical protein